MNDIKKHIEQKITEAFDSLKTNIDNEEYNSLYNYFVLKEEVRVLLKTLPSPVREWTCYQNVKKLIDDQ